MEPLGRNLIMWIAMKKPAAINRLTRVNATINGYSFYMTYEARIIQNKASMLVVTPKPSITT